MRIEKDIPSGYEPQRRMMIVISPIPKAYRHLPFIVIGDVTMSVAMKKEPRRSPPPRTWNSGLTYVEGSMSAATYAWQQDFHDSANAIFTPSAYGNAPLFDLRGLMVDTGQPGNIYVRNGKKFFIK